MDYGLRHVRDKKSERSYLAVFNTNTILITLCTQTVFLLPTLVSSIRIGTSTL